MPSLKKRQEHILRKLAKRAKRKAGRLAPVSKKSKNAKRL